MQTSCACILLHRSKLRIRAADQGYRAAGQRSPFSGDLLTTFALLAEAPMPYKYSAALQVEPVNFASAAIGAKIVVGHYPD